LRKSCEKMHVGGIGGPESGKIKSGGNIIGGAKKQKLGFEPLRKIKYQGKGIATCLPRTITRATNVRGGWGGKQYGFEGGTSH